MIYFFFVYLCENQLSVKRFFFHWCPDEPLKNRMRMQYYEGLVYNQNTKNNEGLKQILDLTNKLYINLKPPGLYFSGFCFTFQENIGQRFFCLFFWHHILILIVNKTEYLEIFWGIVLNDAQSIRWDTFNGSLFSISHFTSMFSQPSFERALL